MRECVFLYSEVLWRSRVSQSGVWHQDQHAGQGQTHTCTYTLTHKWTHTDHLLRHSSGAQSYSADLCVTAMSKSHLCIVCVCACVCALTAPSALSLHWSLLSYVSTSLSLSVSLHADFWFLDRGRDEINKWLWWWVFYLKQQNNKTLSVLPGNSPLQPMEKFWAYFAWQQI